MRSAKRRPKHPISAQESETSKRIMSAASKEVLLLSDVDPLPRYDADEYADLINNARLSFDELCEFFDEQIESMSSASDEDDDDVLDWLQPAVAADSVGKSEAELRAERADVLEGLVTAITVDVAQELPVLSAIDIENIDPARHVETMTALLKASEYATALLLTIDEVIRLVAKPQ
jgi:hypothetical protein